MEPCCQPLGRGELRLASSSTRHPPACGAGSAIRYAFFGELLAAPAGLERGLPGHFVDVAGGGGGLADDGEQRGEPLIVCEVAGEDCADLLVAPARVASRVIMAWE
jgi:hypothetical protein